MTTRAPWLADVLRAAELTVVEHDGWKARGHGDFTDLTHVVWHHDASPSGDSPGVCDYMLGNWDKAAAQLWVSRQGVWHVLAAGVAYHAGKVRQGKPGNRQSLGVETDHTTGEDWPPALLRSLRLGTAAILKQMDTTAARGLEFHKTICEPPGRKADPDGLELLLERVHVDDLIGDPPKPAPKETADVTPQEIARALLPLLERQTIQITGGRRVRTPEGKVEDTDQGHVSNADVVTALERLGERLVTEIRALRP